MSDSRKDRRKNVDDDRNPNKKRKMRVLQDDYEYSEKFQKTKKLKHLDLEEIED